MIHLVVFSHLRYRSVRQRPHHIVDRLAKEWEVLFIEEPDADPNAQSTPDFHRESQSLTVFTPHRAWDEWKSMTSYYVKPIRTYMSRIPPKDTVLFWFYSPNYVRILNYFSPDLVVYDCMDEHSAFMNASPNLVNYERMLLAESNIVFAGGKSLYESKSKLHSKVHCFPSSVSENHFSRAYASATRIPDDIAGIPHPIAGYYGVIDERCDMKLISEAAALAPEMSFVFIGPVVKIRESDLPKAANIYYLGMKAYEDLPSYLKAFDVAMVPFKLSSVTEFLSPTKTLEYMAALKPIVSTSIPDVVRDYSGVVALADTPEDYVKAIRKFLNEPKEKRISWQLLEREIIRRTSWDATVREMKRLILSDIRLTGVMDNTKSADEAVIRRQSS